MSESSFQLKAIGNMHCAQKFPSEMPRQGGMVPQNTGTIELNPHQNFDQALKDLEGMERIWILFLFDQAKSWKPKVQPPNRSSKRISVFATRSPHRPNPIGMTCVRLHKIEDRKLIVSEHDLLDGTPILDIKPYLPKWDSFPTVKTGWLQENPDSTWKIEFSAVAKNQVNFLFANQLDINSFIFTQLSNSPMDTEYKRIRKIDSTTYEIAFRTWRVLYQIDSKSNHIFIQEIYSAYTKQELGLKEDLYADKELHQNFNLQFSINHPQKKSK